MNNTNKCYVTVIILLAILTLHINAINIQSETKLDVQCDAGKYVYGGGCVDCPLGKFTDKSNTLTVCNNCELGTYAPSEGSSTCNICIAGTYSNDATKLCIPCASGTYSSAKAGSCTTSCPPGYKKYEANPGSSSCVQCLVNTYSSSYNSRSCKNCGTGSYASNLGSSFCSRCEAGTKLLVSNENGVNMYKCEPCAKNTYSTAGLTNCLNCSPGYFADNEGSKVCTPCNAGTMWISRNKVITCEPCEKNTYSPIPGFTKCLNCSPGYFADNKGSSFCSRCEAGSSWSISTNGINVCTPCAKGTYSNAPSSKLCSSCDAGKYADKEGSRSCSVCAAGKKSSSNYDSCESI